MKKFMKKAGVLACGAVISLTKAAGRICLPSKTPPLESIMPSLPHESSVRKRPQPPHSTPSGLICQSGRSMCKGSKSLG